VKALCHKKVLGLAIGERSLLLAEIIAGPRPQVRRLAEMNCQRDITPSVLAGMGPDLARFLRESGISTRLAVVGIPARWLLVSPKEMPPVDAATLAPLLRLQAEADFSSDLKDLVYDYAGGESSAAAMNVLMVATPRQYLEAVTAACAAARIEVAAVTVSAAALTRTTASAFPGNGMVLSTGPCGVELTAQRGGVPTDIRHLRGAALQAPFNELRRAVLSLRGGAGRELVLWDGGELSSRPLGEALGLEVREGTLSLIGADLDSAGVSADLRRDRFAPAIALGLAGVGSQTLAFDFLHSRLAVPRAQRIPYWVPRAVLAAALLVGLGVWGYVDIQHRRELVEGLQKEADSQRDEVVKARAFVDQVSLAQRWHGGDARYLACLRDLTAAMPDDGQTYATNLLLKEPAAHAAAGTVGGAGKPMDARTLAGTLAGKAPDQQRVQSLQDHLRQSPLFSNVQLGMSGDAGRGREVSFSILFLYTPAKTSP